MTRRRKFIFTRVFPLIFIVIGIGVAFFGIRGLVRANASVDWPACLGEVTASSVERRSSAESKTRKSTTYHARIRYAYDVDGSTFSGSRVAYGDYGAGNRSHAERIVERYPEGKDVTVYYMPEDPEESLLEPGLKGQAWFLPGFGLAFVAIGTLLAVFVPRRMSQQENDINAR